MGEKDKKIKDSIARCIFTNKYARGIGTSRDAWAYNFSKIKMLENMKKSNDFYEKQRMEYQASNKSKIVEDFINTDPKNISWSRAYRDDIRKNKPHNFNEKYANVGMYRPFNKQSLYFDKSVLNDVSSIANMFIKEKFKHQFKDLVFHH